MFPFDCEPNINLMNGVKVQVMKRCLSIFKKESLVVLPEGLQQLVEMVLISREAKEYFQKRRKDHEENKNKNNENNQNNEKVDAKIEKVDKIEKGKKIDKVETIVEQDKEKVADVVEGSGEWECAGCAAMNSNTLTNCAMCDEYRDLSVNETLAENEAKEEKEEKEEREGETKSSTSHRLAETSTSGMSATVSWLNVHNTVETTASTTTASTTTSTTASSVPSTTISEVVNTRNQSALSSILSQAFLYTQQNTLNERTSSSSRGYQGYGQGGQGGPGGMFSGMAGPGSGMRQRHERHERERQAELERVRTSSTKNSNKSKNKEAGDKEKKEIDELECTLIETTEIVSRLASHQELPIQMVARALHILYPPPVLPELKDLEKIKKLEKSLKSITAQLQEASEEEDHETMEYLDEQRSAIQNQIKKEKKKKTQAEQDIKTKKDKAKQSQKNLKNQKEKEKNPKTAQNITIDEFQAMTKLLFQWTSEEDRELTTFLNDKYIETSNAQPPRSRNRPRSQVSLKPLIATLELPLVRTAKIETRYGKLMDKSITDIRTRASIILVSVFIK